MYEGEFSNEQKNGKGKEYDDNGRLIYEGEFLNDVRHRRGKEYFNDGKLKYEGEFSNGKYINNRNLSV